MIVILFRRFVHLWMYSVRISRCVQADGWSSFLGKEIYFGYNSTCTLGNSVLFLAKYLTIRSCSSVRISRYDARGKFGEHE